MFALMVFLDILTGFSPQEQGSVFCWAIIVNFISSVGLATEAEGVAQTVRVALYVTWFLSLITFIGAAIYKILH